MKLTATKVFLGVLIGLVFFTNNNQAQAQKSLVQEEAQGKALVEQLQSKNAALDSLTEDQFDLVGEYLMGIMMGPGHEAMNQSLVARYGEAGERQMHINMARQFLGYQLEGGTKTSGYGYGFMPMMGFGTGFNSGYGMMGGWGNGYSGMMGGGFTPSANSGWSWGYSMMGGVMSVLWMAILILVLIGLVKWVARPTHH